MAKTSRSDELFKRLRAQGLRKRTAKLISKTTDGRRKPAKAVHRTLTDLKGLIAETEDRISGRPARRKAAAKKAANTRRRNAQRRSASAKKGARTRAKAR
jgi:hypothetical protein